MNRKIRAVLFSVCVVAILTKCQQLNKDECYRACRKEFKECILPTLLLTGNALVINNGRLTEQTQGFFLAQYGTCKGNETFCKKYDCGSRFD